MSLSEYHLKALESRWITPELAAAAGLRSVDSSEGGSLIGRNGYENYSGIAIPYHLEDGSIYMHRLRRDYPDIEVGDDGRERIRDRYLSRRGSTVTPYQPVGSRACQGIPHILVEGEFKALALWRLANHEADTPRWRPTGLQGCWAWRGTVYIIPTPDGIGQRVKGPVVQPKRGDVIVLCPDTNYTSNSQVNAAWRKLGRYCEKQGQTS